GDIHFTGTTAKIDGRNGTLMNGTTVSKAYLHCPDLLNPKTPMEVTLVTKMPAPDLATMLALKHFDFDDSWGLDPKTATGSIDATMNLKFDAFSDSGNKDPNAINFDAIHYDIKAT